MELQIEDKNQICFNCAGKFPLDHKFQECPRKKKICPECGGHNSIGTYGVAKVK